MMLQGIDFKPLTIVLLVGALLLAGCSGAQETPTAEPLPANEFTPLVSATGKIVPEQFTTLSILTGGVVDEVLISVGESVDDGQILVRLQGKEQLQAALSAAQFELANAQEALDQLYEDTDLMAAQALKEQEDAERALEDLQNPELQEALALEAVADARKAVQSSDRRLRTLQSTAGKAAIDEAKAQVTLAREVLDKAQDAYDPYAKKPETNVMRANFLLRLSQAQQAYDAAVRRLNALQGTSNEVDIAVAEAELATAQAQLIQAERELERVKEGPSEAKVALLKAQIAAAKRDYEIYQAGPDPDAVSLAEARLANAQDQLAAAEAALHDLELAAPFAGTVSEVYIHQGQWIGPGQPVLLLADLGALQVETTDLNEIDVARIKTGDAAVVTFDALAGVEVQGRVSRIAPKAAEGTGVNYTVILQLADVPTELRWGMTAFVDITIQD